jgi:hypothetical protein
MSDFFTTLAQTALGSAPVVQPRLASRFETSSTGMDEIEITTDSRPAQAQQHSPEIPEPLINQGKEQTEIPQIPRNVEPLEQATFDEARDLRSPLLVAPVETRAITNYLALIQESKNFAPTKPGQQPLSEIREKEMIHLHAPETVMKEKALPVVQQETVKLELPEMPILQAAPTPPLFKPEMPPTQTPSATVQVTIGRLEIRTPPQQKTVTQASKPTGVMSLEEYRKKRGLQ